MLIPSSKTFLAVILKMIMVKVRMMIHLMSPTKMMTEIRILGILLATSAFCSHSCFN